MQTILEHGREVNGPDNSSALHLAVTGNNLAAVELLVKHDAAVNATDSKGETPFNAAAMAGNIDVVKYLVGQ
jgi:ankyrin repeat protein